MNQCEDCGARMDDDAYPMRPTYEGGEVQLHYVCVSCFDLDHLLADAALNLGSDGQGGRER